MCEIGKHGIDHLMEDLDSRIGSDEIEDDDVLTDAVEDFRAVQDNLEVAVDLTTHLGLHRLEWLFGTSVE